MRPRSLALSLALIFVTVLAGIAVRTAPVDLPPMVVKYGGSMLWAIAIYWVVSTLLGTARIAFAAMIAGLIATGIEYLKLYHAPELEAIRYTFIGTLVLGRIFSFPDIAAYWFAIFVAAITDNGLRPVKRFTRGTG